MSADLDRRARELEVERAQADELAFGLALALEPDVVVGDDEAGEQVVARERPVSGLDVEHLEGEYVEGACQVGRREQEGSGDPFAAPARIPLSHALQVRERDRLGDGGEVDVKLLRT